MKDFKKRTPEQVESSVKAGDNTGGYKFLPWLIYRRTWVFLYLGINIFGIYSSLRDGFGWVFLIPLGQIFLVLILLKTLDYNKNKGK